MTTNNEDWNKKLILNLFDNPNLGKAANKWDDCNTVLPWPASQSNSTLLGS